MNNYVIKELRLNEDKGAGHMCFETFDVLVKYKDTVKWINFHYEDYFCWVINENSNLQAYIAKKKFKTWTAALKDLSELEFDWEANILKFIEANYRKEIFKSLPQYNPDPYSDESDFNDDFDE